MKSVRVPAFSAIAIVASSLIISATAQAVQPQSLMADVAQSSTSFMLAQNSGANLADLEPEVGTIRKIQQGDTMCYITFADELGKTRTTGALFQFCENPRQYLNRKLRLVYGIRSVNDCQSEEPCGKTRRTNLVIRLDAVGQAKRTSAPNSVVLRNRDWTITVGNRNSWSGVNGTGNLTYRGCSSKGQCLNLRGGTVSCRDGVCSTSWQNRDYSYNLLSPITDGDRPVTSTLVIRQNERVVQEIKGLK